MVQRLKIKDLPIKGKTVLMRVDFNVPLDPKGNITDDTRIKASLPTIKYVLDNGGALVLMSHLGRPKAKFTPEFSLSPCAKRLSELLGKEVIMAKDCIGADVQKLVKNLKSGQVALLENLRFHHAEEYPDDDESFVQKLASLGDLYVNDAFGTAHRAHASTASIAKYFPGRAAAGFLLEKEIAFLGDTLLHPQRPFYALVGGAKISTKIGVIKSLIQSVNGILIGGGMAYTFLKAQGKSIGDSIHEDESINDVLEIIRACKDKGVKLMLPVDFVVADKFDNQAKTQIVEAENGIPSGYQGVDIGPKTIKLFTEELKKARTVLWNGPLGVFEFSNFANGTLEVGRALAQMNSVRIVGGGDSIAALHSMNLADKFTHLSTGGGASLEYIEFGTLPGIEALSEV